MNNNSNKLTEVLLELRSASMKSNINNIKSTMSKYNMLFLGEKFNCIYSVELLHSLKTIFNFEISNDELNKLIPITCKSLNMVFEPMMELSNPQNISYKIILW